MDADWGFTSVRRPQAQAADAAVREASAAVAGGAKVAAFRLDVGLDTKALTEAWAACQRAHPQLPVMFLSADASAPLDPVSMTCTWTTFS